MTKRVEAAICPNCTLAFQKLFAHQKYCTVACAFWSRVVKTPDCWLWTGSKHHFGYGEIRYNGNLLRTHQISYGLHYGPVQTGLHVLHHCDNPPCVRPTHLYAGTQAENMEDMSRRYRGLKKLTVDQVLQAECRIAEGESMLSIAKSLGVSQPTISRIKRIMIREGRLASIKVS